MRSEAIYHGRTTPKNPKINRKLRVIKLKPKKQKPDLLLAWLEAIKKEAL